MTLVDMDDSIGYRNHTNNSITKIIYYILENIKCKSIILRHWLSKYSFTHNPEYIIGQHRYLGLLSPSLSSLKSNKSEWFVVGLSRVENSYYSKVRVIINTNHIITCHLGNNTHNMIQLNQLTKSMQNHNPLP